MQWSHTGSRMVDLRLGSVGRRLVFVVGNTGHVFQPVRRSTRVWIGPIGSNSSAPFPVLAGSACLILRASPTCGEHVVGILPRQVLGVAVVHVLVIAI